MGRYAERESDQGAAGSEGIGEASLVKLAQGLIEAKSWPTVLVDACAVVLLANTAATSFLQGPGDWSLGSLGQILHRDADIATKLHARIKALAEDTADTSRAACFVDAADGEHTLLTMIRVAGELPPARGARGGNAIVISFLDGKRRHVETSCKLLADVFALTPAEGRVALALLDGQSLQTYADKTGVSITTVRWHLRNSLAKTACANQRDFVRLIMSLLDS